MKSSTFELSLVIYIYDYLLNYSTLIMRRVLGSSAQRPTRLIESVNSLSHPKVMKSLNSLLFHHWMHHCIYEFQLWETAFTWCRRDGRCQDQVIASIGQEKDRLEFFCTTCCFYDKKLRNGYIRCAVQTFQSEFAWQWSLSKRCPVICLQCGNPICSISQLVRASHKICGPPTADALFHTHNRNRETGCLLAI